MSKRTVSGVGIGDSCALGRAYYYSQSMPTVKRVSIDDTSAELARFTVSVTKSKDELSRVAEMLAQTDEHSAEILLAQREFLDDPDYYGAINNAIAQEQINAEAAVESICTALEAEFISLENEYFRERASDVRDISTRLISNLLGVPLRSLAEIDHPVIVVASDLLPSDTAQLNPKYVLAFCTEKGSATSHTALLANSLGIPAVVGCGELGIEDDLTLIIDGREGEVRVEPSAAEVKQARARIEQDKAIQQQRIEIAQQAAITKDGVTVSVYANIASVDEAKRALELGAEGSGLLRTEFFFYQEEQLPDEERQFELYAEVSRSFGTRPITVRTLDIGGDKPLKALQGSYTDEDNPFLGVRGVRLTNMHPELCASQLRALMRVENECDAAIKIMFPFVSTVSEVRQLRETFDAIYQQLSKSHDEPIERPQIGVMIEIPSAALMIDSILKYVDFASIGTNDLAQYTCAVDRTNEHVSDLADYCHPAILKLIDMVLHAGKAQNKEISICGEMAGDPKIIPLLYGMGLQTYSMSAVRIPQAKEVIGTLQKRDCEELRACCLASETAEEVRAQLASFAASRPTR